MGRYTTEEVEQKAVGVNRALDTEDGETVGRTAAAEHVDELSMTVSDIATGFWTSGGKKWQVGELTVGADEEKEYNGIYDQRGGSCVAAVVVVAGPLGDTVCWCSGEWV